MIRFVTGVFICVLLFVFLYLFTLLVVLFYKKLLYVCVKFIFLNGPAKSFASFNSRVVSKKFSRSAVYVTCSFFCELTASTWREGTKCYSFQILLFFFLLRKQSIYRLTLLLDCCLFVNYRKLFELTTSSTKVNSDSVLFKAEESFRNNFSTYRNTYIFPRDYFKGKVKDMSKGTNTRITHVFHWTLI